jgi:hypothetical protein
MTEKIQIYLNINLPYVRFEVFTVVTMKNAVVWDVAPGRSCENRRFGGTYRLLLHGRIIRERGTSLWLQTESQFLPYASSQKIFTAPHPRRRHSSIFPLIEDVKMVMGLQRENIFMNQIMVWLRHSSSGWSLASNRGAPGSIPGLVKWNLVVKVALRQVFSEYFSFPCQSSFHQLLHNHPHLSSGAGTIGQMCPQYKGVSPTPLAIKKYLLMELSRSGGAASSATSNTYCNY